MHLRKSTSGLINPFTDKPMEHYFANGDGMEKLLIEVINQARGSTQEPEIIAREILAAAVSTKDPSRD